MTALVPRPFVAVIAGPRAPGVRRLVEPALDLVARRVRQRLVLHCDQREHRARPRRGRRTGSRRRSTPNVSSSTFVRSPPPSGKRTSSSHRSRTSPGQPFDAADELEPRQRAARLRRYRVGHPHCARCRAERRLEDVRLRDVPPLHVEALHRLEEEPAAPRARRAARRARAARPASAAEASRCSRLSPRAQASAGRRSPRSRGSARSRRYGSLS